MQNIAQDPWSAIASQSLVVEQPLLAALIAEAALDGPARERIAATGAGLVRDIRASARPGMMEVFLAEYGLSTAEGIALMCLAEALLRVPDEATVDALIEDKIAPSDWGQHLGRSASSLVNASTWALMLTGKVLEEREPGIAGHLRAALKRLGEPVIRAAVARAMREMGRNFVLGETIGTAMTRAGEAEAKGYTYSYDMLGEAARTEADARRYHLAYSAAITAIADAAVHSDIRANPGISVKLSALHPRYEVAKKARVMAELVPRVRAIAGLAKSAGIGLNIDAEEADRLQLSLEVIEAVLADDSLKGWDGFGVVVQAYGRRAGPVIDWLHELAARLDRRIMVRLVKGAYWDAEVKRAQVLGLKSFPVFTRKQATDVSYIALARRLLGMTGRIYPQFATHNAHTVAAIMGMAPDLSAFEFQRLHGMGERLHDIVHAANGTRCRIYAPVGAHRDLLAYLVRRLLENGANSSFVNQIVNDEVPPEQVAACPLTALERLREIANPAITPAQNLFAPRANSKGWDLTDAGDLAEISAAMVPFMARQVQAGPILAGDLQGADPAPVISPATGAQIGRVTCATLVDVQTALGAARAWNAPAPDRAIVLNRAADMLQDRFGEVFALLTLEAGKTRSDAVSELREAVDFLRYYALQADQPHPARGIFACISPWNFPLAIFVGQIGAALAAGNGVIAKPAPQTPLIAHLVVQVLHAAGVPFAALQLLPGGGDIGAALTSDPRISGIAFTGSTPTAKAIRRAMAAQLDPSAPLIAETGGLNVMLVDSTALPEQAVRDILASAFQSAGQRCSALRCLYLQDDIADTVQDMLLGAMAELSLGDPADLATDIGPLIDGAAKLRVAAHIALARAEGRLVAQLAAPAGGHFIGPAVIKVDGLHQMGAEVFGPVLHIATFPSGGHMQVVEAVNRSGYGLTFGLHSRIDDRVQAVTESLKVGNIYVNRNQIGAVVGSQPFGGEGLSGTGPKAGGPSYVARFTQAARPIVPDDARTRPEAEVAAALGAGQGGRGPVQSVVLPGPTGESNRLSQVPRAPLLCLGPGMQAAQTQVASVRALGGVAVEAPGLIPAALSRLEGFTGAIFWGDPAKAREYALALCDREGPILPLIADLPDTGHALHERLVCIDTTAAGGNAQLLAEVGSDEAGA